MEHNALQMEKNLNKGIQMKFEQILTDIKEHFTDKTEYLELFALEDTRVEGWFKGELLFVFSEFMQKGIINSYSSECKVNINNKRKMIDFVLELNNEVYYIEIKALCISQSKGTPRNLKFYLGENNVGIIKDLRKLNKLRKGNRYLIAFIYPKPSYDKWSNALELMSEFSQWKIKSDYDEFEDNLFMVVFENEDPEKN